MRKNLKAVTKMMVGSLAFAMMLTTVNPMMIYAEEKGKSISQLLEQNNSVAMLNYLTVVNQKINVSNNSKLFLEEVYSSLINNTSPNAVNDRTQIQLGDMLQTIDDYRMVDVKRERLQYIYEQNQAQALRDAVPNPLGLLSGTRSLTLGGLVASVVYMAIDSKASYDTAMAQADMEYLQDGWKLDDDATKALNVSRENLFNYMIDMVQENGIPDEYALTEDAVKQFVEAKNNTNVARKIQFLESNRKVYERYGEYWLVLADAYYTNEEYGKCLDAISEYEDVQAKIFRKDYDLAKAMPVAIAAAENVIEDSDEYVEKVTHFAELLKENIDVDDWALRYFAAQTYIDLYSRTDEADYLEEAYKLTLDNVNYLIDEQKVNNTAYLAEIEKKEAGKDATKAEKKEVKEYNKMLKEERKTELPPVYEPLCLNCDLLFELANQLDKPETEKQKIEKILHGSNDDEVLFLTTSINDAYYFENREVEDDCAITYEKGKVILPASFVSDTAKIKITIKDGGNSVEIEDWEIDEVEREKEDDISTFMATYTSSTAKKYDYAEGTKVHVEVTPVEKKSDETLTADFEAHETKKLAVIPEIEFEEIK